MRTWIVDGSDNELAILDSRGGDWTLRKNPALGIRPDAEKSMAFVRESSLAQRIRPNAVHSTRVRTRTRHCISNSTWRRCFFIGH